MTDLERLRELQKILGGPNLGKSYHDMGNVIGRVADEVEKLREALKDADKTISQNNSLIGKMAVAIRRLKEAKAGTAIPRRQ